MPVYGSQNIKIAFLPNIVHIVEELFCHYWKYMEKNHNVEPIIYVFYLAINSLYIHAIAYHIAIVIIPLILFN